MRLFHVTSERAAAAIRAEGFAVSHVRDSEGAAWFTSAVETADTGSANPEYVVVVELPDEVAEAHRYRFSDGTEYLDNFLVPFDVVNAYRPFEFGRLGYDSLDG